MDGIASGNCSLNSFCDGVEPNASAASARSAGTCRIPRFVSRIVGGIANIIEAITPGTTPREKKETAGSKYTKAGIVCIKSRIGVTTLRTPLLLAHRMPIGTPKTMEISEAVSTSASDCMDGSHKPKF